MERFSKLLHDPPGTRDPRLDEFSQVDEQSLECSAAAATAAVIDMALRLLKHNRAPGICRTTSDALKAGNTLIILWLTHIVNAV